MKKIVFVGLGLGTKNPAGIHRNTLEILKEIDKLDVGTHCEIIIPQNEEISYQFSKITVVKRGSVYSHKGLFSSFKMRLSRFIWKNVVLQRYLKSSTSVSVDLLLVFPLKACDVIAVYDCIPEFTPEYYNSIKLKRKRAKLIRTQTRQLSNCSVVITDSNYAKSQIVEFYKIPEEKINVIYCGWQHFLKVKEDAKIISRLNLNNKYYFALGSRFPHKNIKWIANAAFRNPEEQFIVSGQNSSFTDTSFEGTIPENMRFCGYLNDSEVKTLMKHCKAFIQPSFYEGFGIPPMEAMSVGANCIVSDRASLPEVYKNSVWYINPDDYEHVDLDEIMSKPKESNDLIMSEYSWEKSAKKLLSILENL